MKRGPHEASRPSPKKNVILVLALLLIAAVTALCVKSVQLSRLEEHYTQSIERQMHRVISTIETYQSKDPEIVHSWTSYYNLSYQLIALASQLDSAYNIVDTGILRGVGVTNQDDLGLLVRFFLHYEEYCRESMPFGNEEEAEAFDATMELVRSTFTNEFGGTDLAHGLAVLKDGSVKFPFVFRVAVKPAMQNRGYY